MRTGGHVVVGEGFFVAGQTSEYFTDQTLEHVLGAFESAGLAVVTFIRSSPDDFERTWQREAVGEIASVRFGWALMAGRKPV